MLGLDPADRGEEPGVDAVALAGLHVVPQVRGRDLAACQRGWLEPGVRRGLQADDGADHAHHQDQPDGRQAEQREQHGRAEAAARDDRTCGDGDGDRTGTPLSSRRR